MAQNGTCTAFVANQPILRQEGVSEAVGDIIIQCNGNPGSGGAQTLSLFVSGISRGLCSDPEGTPGGAFRPTIVERACQQKEQFLDSRGSVKC